MNGTGLLLTRADQLRQAGMIVTNDGTKTTFLGKTGDYNRIGDAGTTNHSLNSEDDLMVTGELEVKAQTFLDGQTTISAALVISDTNGLKTGNSDDDTFFIGARDNGNAVVEVARAFGGASPSFDLLLGRLTGPLDAATQFVKWTGSLDSAAVANEVSISGFEISAGHRALAISS